MCVNKRMSLIKYSLLQTLVSDIIWKNLALTYQRFDKHMINISDEILRLAFRILMNQHLEGATLIGYLYQKIRLNLFFRHIFIIIYHHLLRTIGVLMLSHRLERHMNKVSNIFSRKELERARKKLLTQLLSAMPFLALGESTYYYWPTRAQLDLVKQTKVPLSTVIAFLALLTFLAENLYSRKLQTLHFIFLPKGIENLSTHHDSCFCKSNYGRGIHQDGTHKE